MTVMRSSPCRAASSPLPTNAATGVSVALAPLWGSAASLLVSPTGPTVALILLSGAAGVVPVSVLSAGL
ncbi:hypothetical protein EV401DRAFT_2018419 [Pisolithus croceorrhizus]|nr:hypothetical protein EV401DRAFT_2018419 [Pisolithus croceorrhizus]